MIKQSSPSARLSQWIFVAVASLVPLVVYLNRFLVPDTSYDTLYYHLFNGMRAAQNLLWPFSKAEFYPAGFGTLPAIYDAILYAARASLGYRLGTILSLAAYVGMIYVVYKLFQLVFDLRSLKVRSLLVFIFFANCVIVTELLFQLATYYVDVFDIFLVVLGLYLFLAYAKNRKMRYLWTSAVVYGLAFYAKETNIIYLLPFLVLVGADVYLNREKAWPDKLKVLVLITLITLAPTALYDFRNYLLTSNPVFPLYNGLFRSKYYSPESFSPTAYGFGGPDFLQQLFWPVASFWHAARLSAPHDIFNDWKLSIEWLLALLLLLPPVWRKLGTITRYLVVFFFTSVVLWGFTSGIPRYAAADEVVGGILLFAMFVQLRAKLLNMKIVYALVAATVLSLIIFDNYRIVAFNLRYDVSWRPGYLYNRANYLDATQHLFQSHLNYGADLVRQLSHSQVALNCVPQSAGLLSLSSVADKPLLNIIAASPNQQMTQQLPYRTVAAEYLQRLYHADSLHFVAFVMSDRPEAAYQTCLQNIAMSGGHVTGVYLLSSYLGFAPYERPVVLVGTISLSAYVAGSSKTTVSPIDPSALQFTDQQALLDYLLRRYD